MQLLFIGHLGLSQAPDNLPFAVLVKFDLTSTGQRQEGVKMLRILLVVGVVVLMVSSASADVVLRVDFNSNQDSGGDSSTAGDPGLSAAAHNQPGWSSYHGNREVAVEFSTANYGGITVTPDWPNTTDNRNGDHYESS